MGWKAVSGRVADREKAFPTGRHLALWVAAIGLLVLRVWWPTPVAAQVACNRIGVDTRDGRMLINSYVVAEPEYVAKMRRQIEQNGEDGRWTVPAGELGSVGYTVTYSCQA